MGCIYFEASCISRVGEKEIVIKVFSHRNEQSIFLEFNVYLFVF